MKLISIFIAANIVLTLPLKAQKTYSEQQICWWENFNDPILITIMKRAVENNYNVISAINNIELAKSSWRNAKSSFYPTVSLNGSYTLEKTSMGIENVDQRHQIGQVSVAGSWEVDIFGSIRKQVQSSKYGFVASELQYNAVVVSLLSQVATLYAQLRTSQQKLNIAMQNLKLQQGIMLLTESNYANGLTTALDAAQSRSLYLQTKASIPDIKYTITQQINALNVLVGGSDASISKQLQQTSILPEAPMVAPNGLASNIILQRPDIKQAQAELDAQIKLLGVARSNYLPKFFVEAEFGYGAHQFSHLTDYDNMIWQIEPSIEWTIFSGGETIEAKHAALAKMDNGVNALNQAIQNAIQEMENSLYYILSSHEQYLAYSDAFKQIQITYNLAEELYKQGLTDYQTVMSSQMSLLSGQDNLISAQLALWLSAIDIYKASGGGWDFAF